MSFRHLYMNAIDWVSVKLNAICFLSFLSDSGFLKALGGIATFTTILYNSIKIYKETKKSKRK